MKTQSKINQIAEMPHVLIVGMDKDRSLLKSGIKIDLSEESLSGLNLKDMISALFILSVTICLEAGESIEETSEILHIQLESAIQFAADEIKHSASNFTVTTD